jgi:hypothetical protein
MKRWLRIVICLVVAVVTVIVMVIASHAILGRSSNAMIGAVVAAFVFATWYLTEPKNRTN